MIRGKAHVFGDDVNTDEIIPARYLNTSDPQELAKHVMEDADPDFPCRVKAGDVIVAGRNFGCGSSREHAPLSLQAAGIRMILAESFARIFFRNAINIGLPAVACEGISLCEDGEVIAVDLGTGEVARKGEVLHFEPFCEEVQEILDAGGLTRLVRSRNTGELDGR